MDVSFDRLVRDALEAGDVRQPAATPPISPLGTLSLAPFRPVHRKRPRCARSSAARTFTSSETLTRPVGMVIVADALPALRAAH
jgi:hypothetical protein